MARYHYRVDVFIMTHDKKNPNFEHSELFADGDLLECRNRAVNYYNEQMQAIETKGEFFSTKLKAYNEMFKPGADATKGASYSVSLFLVECSDAGEYDISLAGTNEIDDNEGRELEYSIFADLGIIIPPLVDA